MKRTLICGGRVLDPGRIDAIADILIEDDRIAAVNIVNKEPKLPQKNSARHHTDRIIDATGMVVVPGLIDLHVHLREPGQTHKETIRSGCEAAAAGGFTAVCAMPNTLPVNDAKEITQYILKKAQKAKSARVYPVAAISLGSKGEQLSPFAELKAAGALALSDDGMPVDDRELMLRALEAAQKQNLPVISHCEDFSLVGAGVMNEGSVARRLGFNGIPNGAEAQMVKRDIELCGLTGASLHIAHVSTAESVAAIRAAKKSGIPVTAETAPHYFTLTDEEVVKSGTNAKMNPPLRGAKDREAILAGLADDTIDVIATDHAPHSLQEKQHTFEKAPNGIIGLETALGLSLSLVKKRILSFEAMVSKLSTNPAQILGLRCGLEIGNTADITLIDPDMDYTVDATKFKSLSRNMPFDGWRLSGRAVMTMVAGNIINDLFEN